MNKKILLNGSLSLLGLGLFGDSSISAAHVFSCGDFIGPGGKHELTADVGPCDDDTGPALTVIGKTDLNMNGFHVFCEDLNGNATAEALGVPDGIVVIGRDAKIENGSVTGCDDGLSLEGEGKHNVKNMHTYGNKGDGMDVESAKNKLEKNTLKDNGDDGFDVDGDDNEFKKNAVDNNGDNGFSINGARNKIKENSSNGNKDRGFDVDGDDNEVKDNEARNNGLDGIRVDEGEDSKIEKNSAFSNNSKGEPDAFDLTDETPGCVNSKWKSNKFGLSNQFCIQ